MSAKAAVSVCAGMLRILPASSGLSSLLQHIPSARRLGWLIDGPLSSRELHTSQSFDLLELWEWARNPISIEPLRQASWTANSRNLPMQIRPVSATVTHLWWDKQAAPQWAADSVPRVCEETVRLQQFHNPVLYFKCWERQRHMLPLQFKLTVYLTSQIHVLSSNTPEKVTVGLLCFWWTLGLREEHPGDIWSSFSDLIGSYWRFVVFTRQHIYDMWCNYSQRRMSCLYFLS